MLGSKGSSNFKNHGDLPEDRQKDSKLGQFKIDVSKLRAQKLQIQKVSLAGAGKNLTRKSSQSQNQGQDIPLNAYQNLESIQRSLDQKKSRSTLSNHNKTD